MTCALCGHSREDHGQERTFYDCDDSRRELCMRCPGYEEPGYPSGVAWHRFRQEAAMTTNPETLPHEEQVLPLVTDSYTSAHIAGAVQLNQDFANGYFAGQAAQQDADWQRYKELLGQMKRLRAAVLSLAPKCAAECCGVPADWLAKWSDRELVVCEKHRHVAQEYHDKDHSYDQTGIWWTPLESGGEARAVLGETEQLAMEALSKAIEEVR